MFSVDGTNRRHYSNQSVISLMQHRAQDATTKNLYTVSSLCDAAVLVGQTLKEVIERDGSDSAQHEYFNKISTMWGICLRSVFDQLPPLRLK